MHGSKRGRTWWSAAGAKRKSWCFPVTLNSRLVWTLLDPPGCPRHTTDEEHCAMKVTTCNVLGCSAPAVVLLQGFGLCTTHCDEVLHRKVAQNQAVRER